MSIDQPARDRVTVTLATGGTQSVPLPASGKVVWGLRPPVTVPGAVGQVLVAVIFSGDHDDAVPIAMVDGRLTALHLPKAPVLGDGPGTETEASSFRTGYGYGVYGDRLVSFETRQQQGVQRPDGTYWTWRLEGDQLVPVSAPDACVLPKGTGLPLC